jgi:hypothetical protein
MRSFVTKVVSWVQQPTTIAGISTIAGTVSAALMHQINWFQAAPLLAGAAVAIALPDNTAAKSAAVQLVQDLETGAGTVTTTATATSK